MRRFLIAVADDRFRFPATVGKAEEVRNPLGSELKIHREEATA